MELTPQAIDAGDELRGCDEEEVTTPATVNENEVAI